MDENCLVEIKERMTEVYREACAVCAALEEEGGREALRALSGLWGFSPSRLRRMARVWRTFGDEVDPAEPLQLYEAILQIAESARDRQFEPMELLEKARNNGWSAADMLRWGAEQTGQKRTRIVLRGKASARWNDGVITLIPEEAHDRRPAQVRYALEEIV